MFEKIINVKSESLVFSLHFCLSNKNKCVIWQLDLSYVYQPLQYKVTPHLLSQICVKQIRQRVIELQEGLKFSLILLLATISYRGFSLEKQFVLMPSNVRNLFG